VALVATGIILAPKNKVKVIKVDWQAGTVKWRWMGKTYVTPFNQVGAGPSYETKRAPGWVQITYFHAGVSGYTGGCANCGSWADSLPEHIMIEHSFYPLAKEKETQVINNV